MEDAIKGITPYIGFRDQSGYISKDLEEKIMREYQGDGVLCKDVYHALEKGGKLVSLRIAQHVTGQWFISFIADWLDSNWRILGVFSRPKAKNYKRLYNALDFVIKELGYDGEIVIIPYKNT